VFHAPRYNHGFSVAPACGKSTVFEVAYVGSIGRHLPDRPFLAFISRVRSCQAVGNAILSTGSSLAVGQNGVLGSVTPSGLPGCPLYADLGGTSAYILPPPEATDGPLDLPRCIYIFPSPGGGGALCKAGNESGDLVTGDPRPRVGRSPYIGRMSSMFPILSMPDGARGSLGTTYGGRLERGGQGQASPIIRAVCRTGQFWGRVPAVTLPSVCSGQMHTHLGELSSAIAPVFRAIEPQWTAGRRQNYLTSIVGDSGFRTNRPLCLAFLLRSPNSLHRLLSIQELSHG